MWELWGWGVGGLPSQVLESNNQYGDPKGLVLGIPTRDSLNPGAFLLKLHVNQSTDPHVNRSADPRVIQSADPRMNRCVHPHVNRSADRKVRAPSGV